MKEHKFDPNVEKIYLSLSDEEKQQYKKKQNGLNVFFLVTGILLILLFAAVEGVMIYLIGKDYVYSIFTGIVLLLGVCIIANWIIKPCVIGLKANDETTIKMHIERRERQKALRAMPQVEKLQKDISDKSDKLSAENIKWVTILDSYTEVSDKLHALMNYQEIIQTRVYKFKVEYNDGTSKIVTAAEGSEEYSILMPRVRSAAELQGEPIDHIQKLREYKRLLDDGIITQEEFEAKKKEILPKI